MTLWKYIERARRTLAREKGTVIKDWGGRLPVALVYPNTYQVGMSSLGFQALYRLFNARSDVVCERVFWRSRLARGEPLLSLETQRPLSDFAVLAFSLSFEMDYFHMVQMLRLADIPLSAVERDAAHPVVIAGGAAVSANPLPVADLVDGVLIGEVEEVIVFLIDALWAGVGRAREEVWNSLAAIPGFYVPHLPQCAVRRQWVHDLNSHPTATTVYSPDAGLGGMHLIEVARGCGRGCRFCLAGFTTYPKREHSPESVLEQARRGLAWSKRVGLVGAAVSDYSQIDELVAGLRAMGVRIAVSSLRVRPLSDTLLRALAESGIQTLTLAPEAGSERLRRLVRKGVSEDDLLDAVARAARLHFPHLKLYFMLGLPTEEDRDVAAIAALCEKVAAHFKGRLTASVTPFVPKAHTPFQRAEMAPIPVLERRLRLLERRLRRQNITVRSESPRRSLVQGILARGDRSLGAVLCKLQSNSLRAWQVALRAHDLTPGDYVRARKTDEPLPWAFINMGTRVGEAPRKRSSARMAHTAHAEQQASQQDSRRRED